MRYFNTAGPCLPGRHYMLPPESRLPEARGLVERGHYFVVHAPRQTGKTTTLATLARALLAEGEHVALRFSCETGEVAGDDYAAAQGAVLGAIRSAAESAGLAVELMPPDPWPEVNPERRLFAGLQEWARRCPKPLVLFFDEIDALRGDGLVSVLRQLRDGYTARPDPFPHSVVLCGLRDVRDYRAAARGDRLSLGTASPFNIKIASLRIGDFSEEELRELYGQHTAETGQEFTEAALEQAYHDTAGQPWLVNALAREITEQMQVPASQPVTAEHLDEAKERLILARATHLDSLAAKLGEPRVRRVMEPLIAGVVPDADPTYNDDVSYVADLGLVAPGWPVRVANPIYQEVIVRVLGEPTEAMVWADPRSFVQADGRLDFRRLLDEFAEFWREHGEVLEHRDYYHEAAPQLVLMGFLHRIVNGGGYVTREYGTGWKRVDICVRWPYQDGDGKRVQQREAIELKVWRRGRDPLAEGLTQLDQYLDRLGLETGTLVIFDRRDGQPPPYERTRFGTDQTPSGRPVTLLRA